MSSFRTRRALTKQPAFLPVIDRSNPKNRSLRGAWDIGFTDRELSGTGTKAENTSGTGSALVTSAGFGRAMRFTDGGDPRIRVDDGQTIFNVTTPYTLVVAAKFNGFGEVGFGRIVDTGAASGGIGLLGSSSTGCLRLAHLGTSAPTDVHDSTVALVLGQWNLIVVRYDGTNAQIWLNGQTSTPSAINTPLTITGVAELPTIGNRAGSSWDRDFDGDIGPLLFYGRAWSDSEITSLGRSAGNIYSLFTPTSSRVFVDPAAAGANTTGTLAVTLADATLAGIGGVTRSGTLATTLADATLASIGAVTRSGTLAVTLADATLAGQGTVAVGANISGSAAITLADATLAGIGAVTRSGTTSTTLADATLAGVGAVTRSGTLSVTLDNATLTGVGTITGETVPVSHGGGMSQASNVSGKKKPKKKAKAVESEEWLKAEETARQLLQDRFKKTTPEAKAKTLEAHIESLQPIIQALKALSEVEESNTVQEKEPVQETRTEPKVEQPPTPIDRYDVLLRRLDDLEDLIVIMMANQ